MDDVSLSLPHKKNYVISDEIRKDFKLCNETSVSLPETEEVLPVQQQYGGVSGVCKKRRKRSVTRFSDDIMPHSPAERGGDRDGKSDLKRILCHK